MKLIMETFSGRKGIKFFNNINEYVDFMTKFGHKIKKVVESDIPYNDKSVDMPKVTPSQGWEQVDNSAFSDLTSNGEKSDCLLSKCNSGEQKSDAKFEPSKSSEKSDKQDMPKVEQSPVKTSKNGDEKEVKEFTYNDSDNKEEKSDDKEDKKEKVNEAVETQLDMFDDEYNTQYVDGVQTYDFHTINNFMGEIAPNLSYTKDVEKDGKIYLGYQGNNLNSKEFKRIKESIKNKFQDNVKVQMARAEYAPEQKTLYISYIPASDDQIDEAAYEESTDYLVDEYFVYLYMICYGKTVEQNDSLKYIVNKLTKKDKRFTKIHERLMGFINDNLRKYPSSVLVNALQRLAYSLGVSESILDKAKETFDKEELNENNMEDDMKETFDDEILETLRIAGVNINEDYDLESDDLDDNQDIDEEAIINEIKQIMKDENISEEEAISYYSTMENMEENFVKSIWNEYNQLSEQFGEQAYNDDDGDIDEKSGKEKLFEEDPLEEAPMSDEEFDNLKDGDKINWDLAKYNSNFTVRKNNNNLDLIGDEGQGNKMNQNSLSDKEYIKQYFSKGKKVSPDKNSLEYAQDQVRAWKKEKERAEYDDFSYSNGKMHDINSNLRYWQQRVKELSSNITESENETLEETKPARYNQHLGKDKSFANISASRSNDEFEKPGMEKEKQKQSEENNRKTAQLKKDIKDMGLSYIKTYGAWRDEGPVTQENSFLIPNITKEQALELGKKYGQYSVIFKDKGDDTAYMYITLDGDDFGKKDMTFDMSKDAKFSQVKKGKDELDPYSGWTGLKPGGKGYNLSYNVKDED